MDNTGSISWGFSIVGGNVINGDVDKDTTYEFIVSNQGAMESWLLSIGHILIENTLHNPNLREFSKKNETHTGIL